MPKKRNDRQLVLVGRNAVVEAISSNQPLQKVYLQKGITGPFEVEVRNLCKTHEVPFAAVPKQMIEKWTKANHQGIIALKSPVSFYILEDVIDQAYRQAKQPLLLALDGVQDVRNFGAIARTAEAFGVHGILFPAKGTAMINDFSIKTSAGSLLRMPLIRVPSLGNALQLARQYGLKIVGAELNASTPLTALDGNEPIVIIMGSEGDGIRPHIRRMLDQAILIPQSGPTESLNVGVAAGIVLYDIQQKRNSI